MNWPSYPARHEPQRLLHIIAPLEQRRSFDECFVQLKKTAVVALVLRVQARRHRQGEKARGDQRDDEGVEGRLRSEQAQPYHRTKAEQDAQQLACEGNDGEDQNVPHASST